MKPKPKPPVHNCPTGWTKVPPQGAPAGYQVIAVDGINPDGSKWGIMCMKPKPEEQGYPSCASGESLYKSPRLVPKGWTARTVTLGKHTIYCAKPQVLLPEPNCASGEKPISSPRLAPKGWTVRKVTLGKRTIYCAKPGQLVPVKPICKGGKLVLLKTMPPRWSCRCPARTVLKGGSCTKVDGPSTNPQSSVPLNTTPPVKPCPKGWTKVRGKCTPPRTQTPTPSKPEVKPCPKGWTRTSNGGCKPPQILKIPPKVKLCPKGWSKVRGNCVPPKPKPEIKIDPKLKLKLKPQTRVTPPAGTKPATQFNPNLRLKLSGQSSTLR
jgi:hypothetical protein